MRILESILRTHMSPTNSTNSHLLNYNRITASKNSINRKATFLTKVIYSFINLMGHITTSMENAQS